MVLVVSSVVGADGGVVGGVVKADGVVGGVGGGGLPEGWVVSCLGLGVGVDGRPLYGDGYWGRGLLGVNGRRVDVRYFPFPPVGDDLGRLVWLAGWLEGWGFGVPYRVGGVGLVGGVGVDVVLLFVRGLVLGDVGLVGRWGRVGGVYNPFVVREYERVGGFVSAGGRVGEGVLWRAFWCWLGESVFCVGDSLGRLQQK